MSKETNVHRCQFETKYTIWQRKWSKDRFRKCYDTVNPERSCQEVCIMQAVFIRIQKRRIKKWFNSYIFRLTTTLHRQLKVFRIFYKEQDNNAILKYVSDVNLHCPINILYNLRSWFKLNYIFMQITINISTVVQTTSKKLGTEAWILLMQWVKPLIWGIIEKKIISSVDSHHLLNLKGMCRYLVHLMIIM